MKIGIGKWQTYLTSQTHNNNKTQKITLFLIIELDYANIEEDAFLTKCNGKGKEQR